MTRFSRTPRMERTSDAEADERLLRSVFPGEGAAQQLCRETDWAGTTLGPVVDWPVSLRTAVAIVLGSAFPAILVWGPERVQLYNDKYTRLIGSRHPTALGISTHVSWPEYDSGPDVARIVAESRVPVLMKPSGIAALVERVERLAREIPT